MKGLTNITYVINENRYDEIVCKINGKNIYIPIIGNVRSESDKQMIDVINDLIQRELLLNEK